MGNDAVETMVGTSLPAMRTPGRARHIPASCGGLFRVSLLYRMMPPMRALFTAIIYFGTFPLLGWVAKRALDRWTAHRSQHASEAQGSCGDNHQPRFLLGVWHR